LFIVQNYRPLVSLFLFEAYLLSITIVNAHQVRFKIGGYLLTTLFIVTVLANTARIRGDRSSETLLNGGARVS